MSTPETIMERIESLVMHAYELGIAAGQAKAAKLVSEKAKALFEANCKAEGILCGELALDIIRAIDP